MTCMLCLSCFNELPLVAIQIMTGASSHAKGSAWCSVTSLPQHCLLLCAEAGAAQNVQLQGPRFAFKRQPEVNPAFIGLSQKSYLTSTNSPFDPKNICHFFTTSFYHDSAQLTVLSKSKQASCQQTLIGQRVSLLLALHTTQTQPAIFKLVFTLLALCHRPSIQNSLLPPRCPPLLVFASCMK